MALFIISEDRQTQVLAANAMATTNYMHLDKLSDIGAYRNHNVQQCKMQIP